MGWLINYDVSTKKQYLAELDGIHRLGPDVEILKRHHAGLCYWRLIKVGVMVKLKDTYDVKVPLTITSLRPLRGQTTWGTTFRLPLRSIGAIVPTV